MKSGSTPSAVAMNGREPFATTAAGSTLYTGNPAEIKAAAISPEPMRRSGTPNRTSTPAPVAIPTANARATSTGPEVPVINRVTAASHRRIQTERRHGRLSHGAAAIVHATAAARSPDPVGVPPVTHDDCPWT